MRFDRPAQQATEPQAKRESMSALCHGLMVDSTFERSENVAITQLLLACSEGCGLHYDSIVRCGAAFICACALH